MELHYSKHHQTYINNLNAILDKYPKLAETPLEDLIEDLEHLLLKEEDKKPFINNAGGAINHSFFWKIMGPKKEIDEKLVEEINESYGSVEAFKKGFSDLATKHFGSGWVWLVRDADNLTMYSLPNQDSPLSKGHTPLIALDVWEHAYYLKYQNRRAEYIAAWWNVLKLI